MPEPLSPPSGVVIVDKPTGPTSHDIVGWLRRTLRTRKVGHGGTLDPAASGVLVVLVGEATKLGAYLTAQSKRYEARVVLGAATTTLDAAGEVTAEAPVPAEVALAIDAAGEAGLVSAAGAATSVIEAALEAERRRTKQLPPAHSAIHVGGRRSYELARAGEAVELALRDVGVLSLRLLGAGRLPGAEGALARAFLDLELEVTKGYYVRSFARDLGEHLGVPAHLGALRRTASGPFSLAQAVDPRAPGEAILAAMLPVVDAARAALPVALLTEEGAAKARQGKRLSADDFTEPPPAVEGREPVPPVEGREPVEPAGAEETDETVEGLSAWLDPASRLVAIGELRAGDFVVRRGFSGY